MAASPPQQRKRGRHHHPQQLLRSFLNDDVSGGPDDTANAAAVLSGVAVDDLYEDVYAEHDPNRVDFEDLPPEEQTRIRGDMRDLGLQLRSGVMVAPDADAEDLDPTTVRVTDDHRHAILLPPIVDRDAEDWPTDPLRPVPGRYHELLFAQRGYDCLENFVATQPFNNNTRAGLAAPRTVGDFLKRLRACEPHGAVLLGKQQLGLAVRIDERDICYAIISLGGSVDACAQLRQFAQKKAQKGAADDGDDASAQGHHQQQQRPFQEWTSELETALKEQSIGSIDAHYYYVCRCAG